MKNINIQNNLNKFFTEIKLRKQYIKKIKKKITMLNNIKEKNYKNLSLVIWNSNFKFLVKEDFLVTYIVDITFSQTNTLLHVMDFSGNLIFFCSAGSLKYKGKAKKKHRLVLKAFYKILISKLKFLKRYPIALHLKNVGYLKSSIIKNLKKKLFIKVVKSYYLYPYNGCRKKKVRIK